MFSYLKIRGTTMIDKNILDEANLKKLEELNNPGVIELVEKFINHCKPAKVTVLTDSQEDIDYARQLAIKNREETKRKHLCLAT